LPASPSKKIVLYSVHVFFDKAVENVAILQKPEAKGAQGQRPDRRAADQAAAQPTRREPKQKAEHLPKLLLQLQDTRLKETPSPVNQKRTPQTTQNGYQEKEDIYLGSASGSLTTGV